MTFGRWAALYLGFCLLALVVLAVCVDNRALWIGTVVGGVAVGFLGGWLNFPEDS